MFWWASQAFLGKKKFKCFVELPTWESRIAMQECMNGGGFFRKKMLQPMHFSMPNSSLFKFSVLLGSSILPSSCFTRVSFWPTSHIRDLACPGIPCSPHSLPVSWPGPGRRASLEWFAHCMRRERHAVPGFGGSRHARSLARQEMNSCASS